MSFNDYYPFGMLMPTRHESSDGYRYGFNGKENDNELKGTGNSVDFGARMYDPRLGRWFKTDLFEKEYTALSPYAYTANNPILFIDPDGKKLIIPKEAHNIILGLMKYVFGENNGFSIKNNELIHNGVPLKNLSSEQELLFSLINDVLINSNRKVFLIPNKKSFLQASPYTNSYSMYEASDRGLLTIDFPDKEILPHQKMKMHPIERGKVVILIPTTMMNSYKNALHTTAGYKNFSLYHLVFHELGHAIAAIIKREFHGKYKNINFNKMSKSQIKDWAIRFTNTLLRSKGEDLETGDGQHKRKDGTKPPPKDVAPLNIDKSKKKKEHK